MPRGGSAAASDFVRIVRDQAENFVAGEAERHRAHRTLHHAHVVQLCFDAEPMGADAGVEVDDLHAAPGLGIRFHELGGESEAFKALIAWLGEADEGVLAVKGETAQEAGAKGDRVKPRSRGRGAALNPPELAGALVEHP